MTPKQAFKDHPLKCIACFLVIIGALNWFTIGFFGYNFVQELLGRYSKYIYSIVGLAGVYLFVCKIMWLTN